MANAPDKPRLRKLVPSLGVSDLRRSIAFYREFFGFEPVDGVEDAEGALLWVWMRSGVAELMLQQLDADAKVTLDPALGQSWVLYLRPADIRDTQARLAAAGIEVSAVETTAYGAEECFARDPDGYELWLSVPDSGRGADDDDDEGDDGDAPDDPDDGELDDFRGRDESDPIDGDEDDEDRDDDLPDDDGRMPGPGDRVH
jgi:uncharacterized glyoxalase superfamily protein PhnB